MFRNTSLSFAAAAICCVAPALAAPSMKITDGTAANTVTIDSNALVTFAPGCACVTTAPATSVNGEITWSGKVGDFTLSITGEGKAFFPGVPEIDIGLGSLQAGAVGGALTVYFTDTGFSGAAPIAVTEGGFNMGAGDYMAYADSTASGTVPYGTNTLSRAFPGAGSGLFTGPGIAPAASQFSMTLVETITLPPGGYASNDFSITASPLAIVTPPAPPTTVSTGDTATIGFWANKNGQSIILNTNGGATSTALANWLVKQFPALYGPVLPAGSTNANVAALFLSLFNMKGQKTYAQIMAGALATYVTSTALSTLDISAFHFNTSMGGTGDRVYNTGTSGAAIGLANNTAYPVSTLLFRANAVFPYTTAEANALNTIFNGINTRGDIK